MKFPAIFHLIGAVLIIIGIFMSFGAITSFIYEGSDLKGFVISIVLTLLAGLILFFTTSKHKRVHLRHRDVFCVVTLSWLAMSFFGCLPYLFTGTIDSFTNAFFEAVAGFTTTGATIVSDIEALPEGILFWRSLTQWIGGMGIILFALAILPFIGSGGMQLFRAEVPDIAVNRLRPRIVDTAKVLWFIYLGLTALACALYWSGGMSWFDAINHAFTTLATGGFSTKNASMAHFDSTYIQGVATLLMLLAGVNYTLYFFAFRARLDRVWASSEFRFYLLITVMAVTSVTIVEMRDYGSLLDTLRYSSFQVISLMTGTGYASVDYEQWHHFAQMILIFLMFFGGMIGSTSGGMKQVRILLMLKQAYREIFQLIHPRAVTSLKLDGNPYKKEVLGNIWGIHFLFLLIWILGTLVLTPLGVDMITASSAVVSATANVGPAFGDVGPTDNYAGLPTAAKWVLMFCMLAGRLEIYTVVILLVPRFWRM